VNVAAFGRGDRERCDSWLRRPN